MRTYLEKNSPTLFLSLHIGSKDREQDSKNIVSVLRIYKRLFCNDGRQLEPNQLQNMLLSLDSNIFSILATNMGF